MCLFVIKLKKKLLQSPHQDLASLSYLYITDKYQIQFK